MRFLIHFKVTPEAGTAVEARPGGPGPILGRLLDRLKPESTYFSCSAREGWIVADLDTATVTETMVALANVCGAYPDFHVVMPARDFAAVAGPAIAGAKKIVEG